MYMDSTKRLHFRSNGAVRGRANPLPLCEMSRKQFWLSQDMGRLIRNSARGQTCTIRLDGCNANPETVVFAHAPSLDNGMGLKQAKDFWGAYACSACHDRLDGRVRSERESIEVLSAWMRGIYETQKRMIEQGLISYNDS